MFIDYNNVASFSISNIETICEKTYVIDSFYQVLKTPSKHPDKVHR